MTTSTLDEIAARAEAYAVKLQIGDYTTHDLLAAAGDRVQLIDALAAVEDWCETNQHPTTDYPQGFSRQDYALDDAARRIRAAIDEALGS